MVSIYQLPAVIRAIVLGKYGTEISIESIDFPRFGEIVAKNIKIKRDNKILATSEKVDILYNKNSLKNLKVEKVIVEKAKAYIVRRGEYINISEAFKSGKPSTKKPGTNVPIEKVYIKDSEVYANDKTYFQEVNVGIKNVNGEVRFDDKDGINFEGYAKDKGTEYIIRYNNKKVKYDTQIVIKNGKVDSSMIKLAPNGKGLDKISANLDMDLKVTPTTMFGYINVKNGEAKYQEMEERIKNIEGVIEFKGLYLEGGLKYTLGGIPGDATIFYNKPKEYADIGFRIDKIKYETLETYDMLKKLSLPLQGFVVSDVKGKIHYDKPRGAVVSIDYKGKPFEKYNMRLSNFNGKVYYENKIAKISGDKISLVVPSIGFKRTLTYSGEVNLNSDIRTEFNFKSNLLDLKGEYDPQAQLLRMYQKDGRLALFMDSRDKQIYYLDLKGQNLLENYKFRVMGRENKKTTRFDYISMYNTKSDEVLRLNGNFSLIDKKYNFKIKAKNLQINNLLDDMKMSFNFNMNGEMYGDTEVFNFNGDINKFILKNKDMYGEGKVKVHADTKKGVYATLNGDIDKFRYTEYNFNKLKFDAIYKDDKLKIKDLSNKNLKMSGDIVVPKKELDLNFKVKDLDINDVIKLGQPVIINDANGRIYGSYKDPLGVTVNGRLNKAEYKLPTKKSLYLKGDFKYEDYLFSLEKFTGGNSPIEFVYDMKGQRGYFDVKIKEKDSSKYYDMPTLKYRLTGSVKGEIIKSDIFADINFEARGGVLEYSRVPNILGKMYFEKTSKGGKVEIDRLDILNLRDKLLVRSHGIIDLDKNTIHHTIEKQYVRMEDLEGIMDLEGYHGSFSIKGDVIGKLDNPNYNILINEGKLRFGDFTFGDGYVKIEGDLKKAKILDMNIAYGENRVYGNGEYNIENSDYKVHILSDSIKLDFLNSMISDKYLSNIHGEGKIDMVLSSDPKETRGDIEFNGITLDSKDLFLYLRDGHFKGIIEDGVLKIESFDGKFNQGPLLITGNVILPTLEEISVNEKFYEKIDAYLDIKLDNMIYEQKGFFRLDTSAHLICTDNKVTGKVVLNQGEITKIFKDNKGILRQAIEFVIDKTLVIMGIKKSSQGDYEAKSVYRGKTPEFNVKLRTKDGIKVNIKDISGIVQNFKGKMRGRFDILGKNDKISIIGDAKFLDGSFSLGTEDFIISDATVSMDSQNGKLIAPNPNINIETSAMTEEGKLEVGVHGPLDSLRITVRTPQGVSSNTIGDILSENSHEKGSGKDVITTVLKTAVDSQISSVIFNPVSKFMKKYMHIHKFGIVTDVVSTKNMRKTSGSMHNSQDEDEDSYGFGAHIRAESPIYKDKWFWVARIGLIDGNKYNTQNTSIQGGGKGYNNSMKKYDFKVERRYKSGWSYGVGVTKFNESAFMNDDDKRKNLNYYIDFKFEKKYNSIKDIFSIKNKFGGKN